MKKQLKNTRKKSNNRLKNDIWPFAEKMADEVQLEQEVSEEFRESSRQLEDIQPDTTTNWSQSQDRSEDLINETDPFIQQPEKNTQVPPELVQQKAFDLYEQRGRDPGDDLADWFEAERQIRQKKSLL